MRQALPPKNPISRRSKTPGPQDPTTSRPQDLTPSRPRDLKTRRRPFLEFEEPDKMRKMNHEQIDMLVSAASEARKNAHAPYSGYCVGAAVLTTDGRIFVGCNVENASYGLSVCAERHAIAAAVSAGCRKFAGVAVVTQSDPPAAPCGACRQVLAEFGDFPVILANPAGERLLTTVSDLLPDAFTPESLVKN